MRALGSVARVEMVEVLLLALVAVITAWSGYQAALWNSKSALSYGRANSLRVSAQGSETLAGQQMLFDAITFDSWLVAAEAHDTRLMTFLQSRFRPEFTVAFDAWMATKPFQNPAAPPGPSAMPQYRNANLDRASQLEEQAAVAFDTGNQQRDVADEYVRTTVLLAVVLFLTALSQRFTVRNIRIAVLTLAVAILAVSVFGLVTLNA